MSKKAFLALIIVVPVALFFLMIALAAFLHWDMKLTETRGYGLIGGPGPPDQHVLTKFQLIEQYYRKHYREFDGKWPDAEIIAANVPEVVLAKNQPYTKFGIFILELEDTKEAVLHSTNETVENSKLRRMSENLLKNRKVDASPVVVCVMGAREVSPGVYEPYKDYPKILKEDFGSEAWKTWWYIDFWEEDGPYTYYVQSDIPPIPGCLAHGSVQNRKSNKFYYPEEILPAFKAIYPNADIPEDQILREGRDY